MNDNHSPLNICVVEPRGKSGMIHYAYQLCRGFAENNAQVTLVTSTQYELENLPHNFEVLKTMKLWELLSTPRSNKNKFLLFAENIYKKIRRAYRGIRYIIEWIKLTNRLIAMRPDVIVFGKIEFPFEAIFLRKLKNEGLLLVDICHEFERRELGRSFIQNWFNKQYNSAFENFSILFFHAENNKDRFKQLFELPDSKLKTIDHGNEDIFLEFAQYSQSPVDLYEYNKLDSNSKVILFFGLLSPSKGIPDLIDAFSIVAKQNYKAKLIIAGFPSKYVNPQEYIEQAQYLDVQDSIIFDFRYIPNEVIGDMMQLATVVVYPYTSSTQSGALQVAYTFGRPVIASNTGGLPEVVEHQKSGLLVPPGNPPELAAAMLTILNNPQKAEEMGAYAKHLSETRFSWKRITSGIIEDIKEIRNK